MFVVYYPALHHVLKAKHIPAVAFQAYALHIDENAVISSKN